MLTINFSSGEVMAVSNKETGTFLNIGKENALSEAIVLSSWLKENNNQWLTHVLSGPINPHFEFTILRKMQRELMEINAHLYQLEKDFIKLLDKLFRFSLQTAVEAELTTYLLKEAIKLDHLRNLIYALKKAEEKIFGQSLPEIRLLIQKLESELHQMYADLKKDIIKLLSESPLSGVSNYVKAIALDATNDFFTQIEQGNIRVDHIAEAFSEYLDKRLNERLKEDKIAENEQIKYREQLHIVKEEINKKLDFSNIFQKENDLIYLNHVANNIPPPVDLHGPLAEKIMAMPPPAQEKLANKARNMIVSQDKLHAIAPLPVKGNGLAKLGKQDVKQEEKSVSEEKRVPVEKKIAINQAKAEEKITLKTHKEKQITQEKEAKIAEKGLKNKAYEKLMAENLVSQGEEDIFDDPVRRGPGLK